MADDMEWPEESMAGIVEQLNTYLHEVDHSVFFDDISIASSSTSDNSISCGPSSFSSAGNLYDRRMNPVLDIARDSLLTGDGMINHTIRSSSSTPPVLVPLSQLDKKKPTSGLKSVVHSSLPHSLLKRIQQKMERRTRNPHELRSRLHNPATNVDYLEPDVVESLRFQNKKKHKDSKGSSSSIKEGAGARVKKSTGTTSSHSRPKKLGAFEQRMVSSQRPTSTTCGAKVASTLLPLPVVPFNAPPPSAALAMPLPYMAPRPTRASVRVAGRREGKERKEMAAIPVPMTMLMSKIHEAARNPTRYAIVDLAMLPKKLIPASTSSSSSLSSSSAKKKLHYKCFRCGQLKLRHDCKLPENVRSMGTFIGPRPSHERAHSGMRVLKCRARNIQEHSKDSKK